MEFVDILRDFGIAHYTEGKNCRPGWVQLDCPWCGIPGKPGLGYKIAGGYCNCYACGGHSAVAVLCKITHEPAEKIKKLLGQTDGFAPLTERVWHKLVMPSNIVPLLKAQRRYIAGRGFDVDEVVETWGVRGLAQGSSVKTPKGEVIRLDWRIFIPIHYRGELVSWTTRSINPDESKRYISAPADCESMPHKELLYGGDFCTHAAVAIEGPIDCWRVGKGAAGLCGIGFSRKQVSRLARFFKRGVWFDNEPQAQKRARDLVDQLFAFPGDTIHFKPEPGDAKDPGSASDNEVQQVRKILSL